MLGKVGTMFGVLGLAAVLGLGCDNSSPAKTGTGGALGGGTGGAASGGSPGTGGAPGGTGGAGGGNAATGGSAAGGAGAAGGSAPATMQGHTMIINAATDPAVTVLDPSITTAPASYANGACTAP